jgi:hypothetical protein
VFFNQLVAQIANAKEFGASNDGEAEANLSKYMTFGDGSPLDVKVIEKNTSNTLHPCLM